jgi:hypothetical protein
MSTIKHFDKPNNLHTAIASCLILCLFFSCGANKNNTNTVSTVESNPKIIFLNYSIKKTSYTDKKISLTNKTITEGRLKNSLNYNKNTVPGDLECLQLDKKSNVLQSDIIKNPLVKNIEYLDNSKAFKRKQIEVDSTKFTLRLQLNPNTAYISINEINGLKKENKPLIKTKLNQ